MQKSFKVASATQNTKFRVGQTVWCLLYGKGEVTDATDWDRDSYPIKVCFEKTGESLFYTQDGEYYIGANRTLFFSEPEVIAAIEPVFEPKLEGKNVIVCTLDKVCPIYKGVVFQETEDVVKFSSSVSFSKQGYTFFSIDAQPVVF